MKPQLLFLVLFVTLPSSIFGQTVRISNEPGPVSATCKSYSYTRYIQVSTIAELKTACANAVKGDMIEILPGEYFWGTPPTSRLTGWKRDGAATYNTPSEEAVYDRGTLYRKHGTKDNKITVCGPRTAILDASDKTKYKHAAFSIVSSSHIRLVGFTLQFGYKGLDIQNSTSIEVFSMKVRWTLQEGIRVRFNSKYNRIHYNRVLRTGLSDYGKGEGMYIGTAADASVGAGYPADRSDYNLIYSNKLGPGITAENIDVKEYTRYGQIYNNKFDGSSLQGVNAATSFLLIKGNYWTVRDNIGTFTLPTGSGYRVANVAEGEGQYNTFQNNTCTRFQSTAFCTYLSGGTAYNTVRCSKVVGYGNACNCDSGSCSTFSLQQTTGASSHKTNSSYTKFWPVAAVEDRDGVNSHAR